MISIAIVSHGQSVLVLRLLASLAACHREGGLEVIVVENLNRGMTGLDHGTPLRVRFLTSPVGQGLAKNINFAFRQASGETFCMLNPDVVFVEDPFPGLLQDLQQGVGQIVAPRVEDETGRLQDSGRYLPTPWTIVRRRLTSRLGTLASLDDLPERPHWIAGLFLLMPAALFRELDGMDERYFLYFEDVDFCSRARLRGYSLFVDKSLRVVHEARRASRRNLWYLGQHLASAVQFFFSPVYREARRLSSPPKT